MTTAPARRMAGPATTAVFSVALTYGGILWLHLLHEAEGATELNAPPGALHWLRDATLALPLVTAAVWLGTRFALGLLERWPGPASRLRTAAVQAASVALYGSTIMALGNPLHGLLFDAHHGGHELSPAAHLLRDGLLAMAANLVLAGGVTAALHTPGGLLRPIVALLARRRLMRELAVRGGLATLVLLPGALVAPSGAMASEPTSAHAGDPGNPCPVGAPTRHFDVAAIDVDITLNRFGDHDPRGKMYVLAGQVDAVRAEEHALLPARVSIGLRGDAIQPLVIRANEGECVEIAFTNNASSGEYGMHIDGLAFESASSGDAVGANPSSAVPPGQTRLYRYWVPDDDALEGAHYIHPGPGNRAATNHGLFGALAVEPRGSTFLDPTTTSADGVQPSPPRPLESGWDAIIVPGDGRPAFREHVLLFDDIGDESEPILNRDDQPLPELDPHTGSYRPGARGLNYRSEPFMDRLDLSPDQKSQTYGSYTFGDPPTPMPRGYVGDPTKIRVLHASSEVFHVFHLHGGGIRWRFNPKADSSYDYAATGLDKHPRAVLSASQRLDSQSLGPGEAYDMEIEGGAGGVQQGAGEFLFHCHIAAHYFSGMWGFWRVFDTLQPDLAPLPDRAPLPAAVDSSKLVGQTMPDGTLIDSAQKLDAWVRPQLPPQGTRRSSQDASVMDWLVDPATGQFVGEPEDTGDWVNLPRVVPGHPGSLISDRFVPSQPQRPLILFNPSNGRPAFPLLRPHVGDRPPFAPNGHSGAPYLGERGATPPTGGVDPWANRPDGICPTDATTIRRHNLVAINLPIQNTAKGVVDDNGALFVLAQDKDDVYAGRQPAEPLALRANIGDCVFNTFVSEEHDGNPELPFSKANIHIHHVQFDTQASDGVISGFSFEQSVRPYQVEDPQLTAAADSGDVLLRLTSVAKFQPGVSIGIGLGTDDLEIRQIVEIGEADTVRLDRPLDRAHPAGEWAGVEFVQYIWYPDVELDNVFFHDHVNGIHGWSHGLVGQLIVEPAGSTYHDPRTGQEVASGTLVDIHTSNPLAPGVVDGSFRELALWTIDDHSTVGSSLNLRAEPWQDRDGDPADRFSSRAHGDPYTPLPRAYPGDPFVIRTINVGQGMQTLHIDGHRTRWEPRYPAASPVDTIHYGVSERFTLALEGGAGGPRHIPGDYLYHDGVGRSFRDGAWGILRVLESPSPDLQALPGITQAVPEPVCPPGAPVRHFQVSAVDLPGGDWGGGEPGRQAAFVPSDAVQDILRHQLPVEPLVLHVATGDCVTVTLTNQRSTERASFSMGGLLHDLSSSGLNIGANQLEQTVAPGQQRDYTFYADSQRLESNVIADFGGDDTGRDGLYGAVVVAPAGATFSDPRTGGPRDIGAQVDVHVPGAPGYRDFTLVLADQDPIIGQNTMPYPRDVAGPALVNYRQAGQRPDDATGFSSLVHGDPATPLLQVYAGDRVKVHALVGPGSEQLHVLSLGGLAWPVDPSIDHAQEVTSRAIGAWEKLDAVIRAGAGGRIQAVGDFAYSDRRLAFTQAGMWGLLRVLPRPACQAAGADQLVTLEDQACLPQPASADARPVATGGGAAPAPASADEPGLEAAVLTAPATAGQASMPSAGLPPQAWWAAATAVGLLFVALLAAENRRRGMAWVPQRVAPRRRDGT